MNLVELALRLKKLRTERGLTLEQVAAHATSSTGHYLRQLEAIRGRLGERQVA